MRCAPLENVRILDFTWQMAGPYATTLLAFLGAEVIKVESMARLDFSRRGPNRANDPNMVNRIPRFNDNNLNKLSITLNLTQPRAVELAKELASVCDVVVENMRPGAMEKLGVGYSSFVRKRPDIIMCSVCTMGSVGPEKRYAGYAPLFSTLAGLAEGIGYPDGPPTEGRGVMDATVATAAAFAIIPALYYRKRTGEGQHIDLSGREAIISCIGEMYVAHSMNGYSITRMGNRDDIMAPHNVYKCRGEDAWVSVAVGTQEEWHAFCRAVGHQEWLADERFSDPYRRWKNQEALDKLIEQWTATRTAYEVMNALQAAGVAAGVSSSSKDLYTDPHLQSRGFYQQVSHPFLGERWVLGPQWKLSSPPAKAAIRAPLLGEHNSPILGDLLGVSVSKLQELKEAQVVY